MNHSLFACLALFGLLAIGTLAKPQFNYYIIGDRVVGPNLFHQKVSQTPADILAKAIRVDSQSAHLRRQPPPVDGGGGPEGLIGSIVMATGESSSDQCKPSSLTTCAQDGTSNYFLLDGMTYDPESGRFSGTFVTNLCPWYPTPKRANAECISQQFPDPTWDASSSSPSEVEKQVPLLGRLGLSVHGLNTYSSLEAGFEPGFACSSSEDGYCEAGMAVLDCGLQLEFTCDGDGEQAIDSTLMLDECGGHATPYHHHTDLACDYSNSSSASSFAGGHSPLVGIALDGVGIYGIWESEGEAGQKHPPMDLDACGGHVGPVPSSSFVDSEGNLFQVEGSEAVYHYHTNDGSEGKPYTIACFNAEGATREQCQDFYEDCGEGFVEVETEKGVLQYDVWCPCYVEDGQVIVKEEDGSNEDGDGDEEDGGDGSEEDGGDGDNEGSTSSAAASLHSSPLLLHN
ncbi:YHYH domain-containing protein [Balamuthia mandrillaris]